MGNVVPFIKDGNMIESVVNCHFLKRIACLRAISDRYTWLLTPMHRASLKAVRLVDGIKCFKYHILMA